MVIALLHQLPEPGLAEVQAQDLLRQNRPLDWLVCLWKVCPLSPRGSCYLQESAATFFWGGRGGSVPSQKDQEVKY